jgi:cobalt-zinc-cadmium efflux system outer membrane protein
MKYKFVQRSIPLLFFSISLATHSLKAQNNIDTLRLSYQQVEKQFIDSNFLLLAAHYNVDAQKALIEQSKLWQNPTINTDFLVGADGKFFNYGKYLDGNGNQFFGQYYVQVQQLILTAKKRGKLINMATTNAKLSELQLQDVMRNLRYQLKQDYYNILQQEALLSLYKEQEVQLNGLIDGMQAQFNAGNIANKDLIRVQALRISLQQDITELQKSIADNQADLKTLLQIKQANKYIKPTDALALDVPMLSSMDEAIAYGLQNNPYYQLQKSSIAYQQQNLAYQKALKYPDITLGPNFDRNSNFAPSYVGLGISMPIPIFNKNQGNIKAAQWNVKQQEAITQNAETDLTNNITGAYKKFSLTIQQNSKTQTAFYNKYQQVYNNMVDSYKRRLINLLEFLDFYNDYNESQQRQLQQSLNLQLAQAELNYHLGK